MNTKEQTTQEQVILSPELEDIPVGEEEPKKKRGRGRPRKTELQAKMKGGRGKVGRPQGDHHRINELKARLLTTTGDHVINKIVQIAMDDSHQGQMAALKMCIDRVLPLSYFEKEKGANSKPQITINISNALDDQTKVIEHENSNDGYIEYTDVEVDDE